MKTLVKAKKEETSITHWFKKSEQNLSFILGIIVVLIISGLIFKYFQNKVRRNLLAPIPGEFGEKETEIEEPAAKIELPSEYIVIKGDHLWKIAEKFYGSGYNWVDIAKENKLRNPNLLKVGQKLIVPKVEAKKLTIKTNLTSDLQPINDDTYTVQKNDSLSKIALMAYGDMFAWPKIFAANKEKISNPALIYPGQTLKIPR